MYVIIIIIAPEKTIRGAMLFTIIYRIDTTHFLKPGHG